MRTGSPETVVVGVVRVVGEASIEDGRHVPAEVTPGASLNDAHEGAAGDLKKDAIVGVHNGPIHGHLGNDVRDGARHRLQIVHQ